MIARERLLEIAEDMMSRRGYAGTSVAEIVQAAGVGPPTLYWHFKNKQGILAAVMERGAERWFESLPTWDDVSGTSAHERFLAATQIGSSGVRNRPQFLRLLMLLSLERGEHDEAVMRTIRSIRSRGRAWMIGLLQRGWPTLPDDDAETLAFRMMAFADGLCLRRIVESDYGAAEVDADEHHWLTTIVARDADAFVSRRRER